MSMRPARARKEAEVEEDRAAEGREEEVVDGVSRKTLTRFMASEENSAREREKRKSWVF